MTDETRRRLEALSPEQRKALAAKLAAKRSASPSRTPAPHGIPKLPRDADDYALSFEQHRMWFLHQLDPTGSVHNNPLVFRLSGTLDASALQTALDEVVRRHEVLRTTFTTVDGVPRQVVQPRGGFGMRRVDLRAVPGSAQADMLRQLVTDEIAKPFDLARGPLVRALLARTGKDEHVLAATLHHIVSDGWSVGVLMGEVGRLYATVGRGVASPLPELAVQYLDFAGWQRGGLDDGRIEEQVAFWREELAGAPAALELPTDRPRPAKRSARGSRHPLRVDGGVLQRLEALGQEEGATLFMTLMAAYHLLLHRWSGQDDIVVGTPMAGRDRPELEPLIGFFVRTSMVRARTHDDPTFRELLRRVKRASLGAFAHQDVPFEKLVEELDVVRDTSATPLFQVSFVMQNYRNGRVDVTSDLKLEPMDGEHATSEFDVTLTVSAGGDGLVGQWEYRSELFDASTIERMSAHYATLLNGLLEDADRPLSAYPLVDADELRAASAAWNDTRVDLGTELLPRLFEARVATQPDAIALTATEGCLTYRDLDARANRLARYLIRRGVGPEVRVAVHLERGPDLMIGLLGVLKAGGCYIPIDPEYPAERIRFVLEDSGAALVVTSGEPAEMLGESGSRAVRLDIDAPTIARESSVSPPVRVGAESSAYVIYTSGSTGRPKGTVVQHGGLANYLLWATDRYSVASGRGAVVHSPIGFDLTVTSLFCPLVAGQSVHLLERVDADGLGAALTRRPRMSLLKLTPSHLELLRHQIEPAAAARLAGVLVVGGEPLRADATEFWRTHAPRTRIINEYGPTEAVVGCCVFEVSTAPRTGDVPIGRPIANTRLYVCDERGRLVPDGLVGELHIGGAGVTRGYLSRPGLTADRYVPDPGSEGARRYRSGDLVRMCTGGELEFLGRTDDQVKIRGHRVELGEVEAAVLTHADVAQVAVIDRVDHSEARYLAAYVVAGAEVTPSGAELRTHVRAIVPEYMTPGRFVFIGRLPLTSNGKVDRSRLPAPDAEDPPPVAATGPGSSPLHELVAGIWEDVLAVDRVGADDDFFHLGGHSLLATRLLSRVRHACGVEVTLAALFEEPTVAGLCTRIRAAMGSGEARVAPPIERAASDDAMELSFAQQRLWLLDRMTPGNASYNVVSALRLAGPLDPAAFESAVSEIVRRHEILRTTFIERDGRAARVVHENAPSRTALVDIPSAGPERVDGLVAAEATRPFDLAAGPLLRVTLLRLGSDKHVVVLTTHHIVCDGWSMSVLVDEFTRLYLAFASGRPSGLADLAIQYSDFAHWQREWLTGEVLEAQLGYWRERLTGAPPRVALPRDRERPSVESSRGTSLATVLPAELASALRELSRREGATLFMTMLAALQTQFHKYTGHDDILIGTDSAGRNRLETEGLIGFFINLLVIRADLGGNPAFRELLAQVRARSLEAYAHQDLPFERLVEELAPERSLNETPIFQVLFVFQNTPAAAIGVSDLALEPVELPTTTSKFDLAIFVDEGATEIGITWQYKTDLFDDTTIERLGRHYETLLRSIVATPDDSIHDLRMVAPSVTQRPRRARARRIDSEPHGHD